METTTTFSNTFVCLLGIGTVFAGLLFLVLMCRILSFLVQCSEAREQRRAGEQLLPQDIPAEIPNRQETVAAVSAVIAEELGAEISAIRILSFRRL